MSNLTKNPVLIKKVIDRWLEKEISNCIDISNTLKSLKITVDPVKGSGRYKASRSFSSTKYQLWSAPQKNAFFRCELELKPAYLSNSQANIFHTESILTETGKHSLITLPSSLILGSPSSMNSTEKQEAEEGKLGISIRKKMSFLIKAIFNKYNFKYHQFLGVKYLIKQL